MEEKADRVEQWFTTHHHPYLLKELVNLIPKATGVIPQSIEEVLELLISEGRVTCDKLGVSNLYWKFVPSAAAASGGQMSSRAAARVVNFESVAASFQTPEVILDKLTELEESARSLDARIHAREADVETPEEMETTDDRVKSIRADISSALDACAEYADRDPLVAEQLRESTRAATEAANRWTENVFLLEQFVTRRMAHIGMNGKAFRTAFGVPDELDFV